MAKKSRSRPPVVEEPREEKKNLARIEHPSVTALKKDERIGELPKDFEFSKHRVIKKTQWQNDAMFFDHLADKCEGEMNGNRTKAEECRKLGSAAERGRAKRLLKMQGKIDELKEELTRKGVDVDALLASVS